MLNRIITFGFPIYLLIFEYLARTSFDLQSSVFIGPTLASIGLGLVLPLTAVEVREVDIVDRSGQAATTKISDPKDVSASHVAWIALLILMLLWLMAIYESVKNPTRTLSLGITAAMLMGGINFVVGVLLSIWRGR